MINFESKKILLISASFFSYEKVIIKRLKELNAEVDFYDERPSNSNFSKGIIRVNSGFYSKKINRYYEWISREISEKKYDFLLLIKGESIPTFFLEKFKKNNPKTEMIFYAYDSMIEYPKSQKLLKYFTKTFTFDPSDALEFGLHFRPVFFFEEYVLKPQQITRIKYDLISIGSAHTDRYIVSKKIEKIGDSLKLKYFFYYYIPNNFIFLLKRIFDKNFKSFKISMLSFKKLSHSEIAQLYKETIAVLDINKPFQKGLTNRTFEVLASKKKLITTNSDIKNYPFYQASNILVIDRNKPEIDPEFFKTDFAEINPKILEMMSLDSWLKCLFFKEQDNYWRF